MKNVHIILRIFILWIHLKKNDECLSTIRIRNFNSLTSSKQPRQKKIAMKKAILNELGERKLKLSDIQLRCKERPLGVKAIFYLLKSGTEGDSKKDLDNLLKILFDVLSDDMIKNNKEEELRGLGLMKDDEMVFEVRSSKRIVTTKHDMG